SPPTDMRLITALFEGDFIGEDAIFWPKFLLQSAPIGVRHPAAPNHRTRPIPGRPSGCLRELWRGSMRLLVDFFFTTRIIQGRCRKRSQALGVSPQDAGRCQSLTLGALRSLNFALGRQSIVDFQGLRMRRQDEARWLADVQTFNRYVTISPRPIA